MIRTWLSSPNIPWYRAVLAFRSLAVVLAVTLLNTMEPLGTSPLLISLAGTIGVIASSRLAQTRITNLAFFLAFGAAAALLSLLFGALNYTLSGMTPEYFSISRFYLRGYRGIRGASKLSLGSTEDHIISRMAPRHTASLDADTCRLLASRVVALLPLFCLAGGSTPSRAHQRAAKSRPPGLHLLNSARSRARGDRLCNPSRALSTLQHGDARSSL